MRGEILEKKLISLIEFSYDKVIIMWVCNYIIIKKSNNNKNLQSPLIKELIF